jgi:hypothetical protein
MAFTPQPVENTAVIIITANGYKAQIDAILSKDVMLEIGIANLNAQEELI